MFSDIQLFPVYKLIFLFNFVWFFSFFALFYVTNFILILISFELMFLSICVLFCSFSYMLDDAVGLVMTLFILGIVAGESALGLAIYISLHKYVNSVTE